MKLYVCRTPIKFPRSEYGGMIAVIAKSPRQLGKILTDEYNTRFNAGYFDLSISVESVKGFDLNPDKDYQPGIVMEFQT